MWLQKSKNLFNKNSVVHGALKEDGTIDLMDGYYYTSDFISVVPGQTYFKGQTGSSRFKFYYKDKTQYSNTYLDLESASTALSFTIPKDVCYIRFTVTQDFLKNLQLERGSVATEYEEFGKDRIFILNDNDVYEEFKKQEYVIESGSNENGEWIKYSDGRLIQRGIININDANFDELYGNVWTEGAGVRTINFPLDFKDGLYTITLYCKTFAGGIGGACGKTYDTSKVTYFLWQGSKYNFNGKNIIVSFEVKGYWK